jgi:LPS-assembly protein
MINKLIILVFIFFLKNLSSAYTFEFESKKIEILDKGNKITANNGKAFSSNGDYIIISDNFEYLKDKEILNSNGNGFIEIKSKNLEIKFDSGIFDQKNATFVVTGNVEILFKNENLSLKTEEIFFNQRKNFLESNNLTKIQDKFENIYYVGNFKFDINNDLLKVKDLIFKDNQLTTIKTPIAFINTKSGNVFGKDIDMNLSNGINNNFRLKGNSASVNDGINEINKGVFTTCEKRDGCSPWQIKANKITHDKKKREIRYDDAVLKIYNLPVAYFPKFFHPDPTVKRKSGFLIPSIKNSSNSGSYINSPFFYVLADNKDFTFSPRFYQNEEMLLQSEYRQKNLKSSHLTDFSFFTKKNGSTKNHFFYNFDKNFKSQKFDTSKISFKAQTTSDDTYLKFYNIKSDIVQDNQILENSIDINLFSNDLSINLNSTIYENLNKNQNDRFEYIFPKLEISKNLNNFSPLNGNFLLNSKTLIRNFDTNVYEKKNINDLIFRSTPKINNYGFYNNYEFLIKNSNAENKNFDSNNKKRFYLSSLYQYNSSFPLLKKNEKYKTILTPKLSFKIAPSHSKDERNTERFVDISNIYSLNRVSGEESIEGGMSATYGLNYSINNNLNSEELFSFKTANNLRLKKNDDLANSNQVGEEMSNFFNEIKFQPHKNFTTQYISSLKNNIRDLSYENLKTKIILGKFETTFDYLNQNNTTSEANFLSNESTILLDNENTISFLTRKNKSKDLTEYYKFMYQYKNDCLLASLEYNKDFYSDRDIKPDESIMFKISIIPSND